MDSIRIDFNRIAWDNKSAGMRVKRFLVHGKQMRLVEILPDSGEANWCDDMLCFPETRKKCNHEGTSEGTPTEQDTK